MCGIIGATKSSEEAIQKSLATFTYRGPDAQHFFSDAEISLGHARLSIIDLDSRADQPFFDEQKEIGMVYNGEIYNYKELRLELERDHQIEFRTTSDTEVLVYAYRVWGVSMLPKLRGMFAFGIYDTRTHTVFLARDHAGIKPLYYSLADNRLLFASELKGVVSLMRQEGMLVQIDQSALAQYPVLGYIPSPQTMVQSVKKLERGSWLLYDLPTTEVEMGDWKPETKTVTSPQELEEAVRRSVLEHCIADVPVGAFFSGGIDSSLIVALLHEAGMDLETFSIHVAGRDADEPYFREIAKHLGVKAQVAEFGVKEFDEIYDDVVSRIDDPIADTSIFPSAFVARLAAKKVKVVLSGEGGDELFLGYPRAQELAILRGATHGSGILDTLFLYTPSFPGKNKLFTKGASLLGLPASYYLSAVSPARDLSSLSGWKDVQRDLMKGDPLWFDRDWYLENMLLRKTDGATSYASIEGRVPLLGAELWNAAPSFVSENMKQGGSKEILKGMLSRYIPRELIDRPKAGFGLDIEMLFRDSKHLRSDLHEAIKTLNAMGFPVNKRHEKLIVARYPVYGFGLVVLHHSLKNLGILGL